MSESKHTPGCWEVHEGLDYRHVYGGECNHSGDPIAVVPSSLANARLIAAAPDLLIACQMIVLAGKTTIATQLAEAAIAQAKDTEP